MSDVVWVAVISAGAALITALLTQRLATSAANKQADRSERREAVQWERTEALRREEIQRKAAQDALAWEQAEALRKQELHDARLRELWSSVLEARWQMLDMLERAAGKGGPTQAVPAVSAAQMPTHAAGQAYGVALLWLTALRPVAREFYKATSDFQIAMCGADSKRMEDAAQAWNTAYKTLEVAVTALADDALKHWP